MEKKVEIKKKLKLKKKVIASFAEPDLGGIIRGESSSGSWELCDKS